MTNEYEYGGIFMKKLLILFMITIFLVGCGEPEQVVDDDFVDILEKGTFEILLSSTNAGDYDSVAVSFSGINLSKGENSIELSITTDKIELVSLKSNKVYSMFQTSLNSGEYNKVELIVKEIEAYKNGEKVILEAEKLAVEKAFVIENGKTTRYVFDVSVREKLEGRLAESGTIGVDIVEVVEMKKADVKAIGSVEVVESEEEEDSAIDEESELTAAELLNTPKEHEVAINGATLNPESIVIKVGDTIFWNNIGKSTHRLYAQKPLNYFRSEVIMPGDNFTFTFEEAGEYPYTSPAYAAYMRGKIIVE